LSINEGDDGILKTNISAVDQIKDNFRNLILTNKGERLGRYDYGCDLRRIVTELNSFENFESIVMESISNSTKKYMPMIDLDSFSSEYNNDTNQELKNIVITVVYNIPLLNVNNQKIDITLYVV
tara:strand:- start:8415 stop:8786 length:372 start_codon:yes stop_codon:yes gene_type:complete